MSQDKGKNRIVKALFIVALVVFVLSFVFWVWGIKSAAKNKEEFVQLKDWEHEFILKSPKYECDSNQVRSKWISDNDLEIYVYSNISVRGAKFRDTKVFLEGESSDNLRLFFIEKPCTKKSCLDKEDQERHCSRFVIKDLERKDYHGIVHQIDQVSPAGIIKYFEVEKENRLED